jgi:hypothetical protein
MALLLKTLLTPWLCVTRGQTPPKEMDGKLIRLSRAGRPNHQYLTYRRISSMHMRCWPLSQLNQMAAIKHNSNHLKLRLQQTLACIGQKLMIIGKLECVPRVFALS